MELAPGKGRGELEEREAALQTLTIYSVKEGTLIDGPDDGDRHPSVGKVGWRYQ